MTIIGWKRPPSYDSQTKRLEWAINAATDHSSVINFNTRILGRRGVTSVVLVVDPERLDTAVGEFKASLGTYTYASSERYATFRPGDRIAIRFRSPGHRRHRGGCGQDGILEVDWRLPGGWVEACRRRACGVLCLREEPVQAPPDRLMSPSYEVQLMAIAIGLYLFDNGYSYADEGILIAGARGTWQATSGSEDFLLMGRSVCT